MWRAVRSLTWLCLAWQPAGSLRAGLERLSTPCLSRYCTRPSQNLLIDACHVSVHVYSLHLEWVICSDKCTAHVAPSRANAISNRFSHDVALHTSFASQCIFTTNLVSSATHIRLTLAIYPSPCLKHAAHALRSSLLYHQHMTRRRRSRHSSSVDSVVVVVLYVLGV